MARRQRNFGRDLHDHNPAPIRGNDTTTTTSGTNPDSAKDCAPGQQAGSAQEAAPGQQDTDAKTAAPEQMKKTNEDC
ncbi:MAG: hypothetical protein EOR84_17700 [Mesorhizobium sp.]|uniref:hypothetical protein n=1 Tax=Mesorhizobium sp. TaxID=1871066 RepID=UPI000FE9EBB4|nr:hypothetical protein [Mesorhizobium sp.]RWM93832.1 MAG: hypothetical protein EOR84_17700 [Mesorhizobium sp.]